MAGLLHIYLVNIFPTDETAAALLVYGCGAAGRILSVAGHDEWVKLPISELSRFFLS